MEIIAFMGSPRKGGNTDLLLRETVRGVEESGYSVKVIRLNRLKIRPCQDCGGCEKTGECVLDDAMTEIYGDIRRADRIILASPIFFFSLSSQCKIMIDRCQSFWCEKYLLKRPLPQGEYGRKGLLLLVGGMKKEVGAECGGAVAKAFFRTVSVDEHMVLTYLGVDAKGAIKEHPSALREAFLAGKELVRVDQAP
jgi:multimeric flavodoxin WrbA